MALFKVPTLLVRSDKTAAKVGGPHCVRECSKTGEIWVALKGSIACHPAETADRVQATQTQGSKSLKRTKERVCCSAKALVERMAKVYTTATTAITTTTVTAIATTADNKSKSKSNSQ